MRYILSLFVAVFMLSAAADKAYAFCTTANLMEKAFKEKMADPFKEHMRNHIRELNNFVDAKISSTALVEVLARFDEFEDNIIKGLVNWAKDHFTPAIKEMTKQLDFVRIDQTLAMGRILDAEMMNEVILAKQNAVLESVRRYLPSEQSCQMETAALGASKAAAATRSVSSSFAREDKIIRSASAGNPVAARGPRAQLSEDYKEYVEYFCNPAQGDQGCTVPGKLPGQHRDVSAMLWGSKQTLNFESEDMRRVRRAMMRYLVLPVNDESVRADVVTTEAGPRALLERRAKQARANAVYNVLGQLIAQRAGGSGVNTQQIRTGGGVLAAETTKNASYSEIQRAMLRDRFMNPEYVQRMLDDPESVAREAGMVNALFMQSINDLYKRVEEMVFMEAAIYAAELDQQKARELMLNSRPR
jgi:hypothetical protein